MNFVDRTVGRIMTLSRRQKFIIFLSVDATIAPVCLLLSFWLFGASPSALFSVMPAATVLLLLLISAGGVGVASLVGLPRMKLNGYEQTGILRTTAFALAMGVLGWIGTSLLLSLPSTGRSMMVFMMLLLIVTVGARIALRSVLLAVYQRGKKRQRVLIYGAGQTGLQLATALGGDDEVLPVAFVDDNPAMHSVMIAGLRVHSPIRIEGLIEDLEIDRVVLAMPSISRPKLARIARKLEETGCDVSLVPSFASLVGDANILDRIQPARPSDFLNRTNHEGALDGLCDVYRGQSVMITGAGGSIGSELVRQILTCQPRRLVLFEVSELALYQLNREMEELGLRDTVDVIPVLGSVINPLAVRQAIARYDVEIVIHAAAYKHVMMVERNILAGLRNNVLGTKVVAEAARDAKVRQFVLVSTDKAVRPTSVMGASKRLAEMVVQDLAARADRTQYSIVRFGNVLGSSGSVVPLFAEQIARGGPVTLTHSDATRFFMTLSEAARLVLLAGNFADGGDIFVLDMGEPVKIRQLAIQMIERAGYTLCDADNPDGDIEITEIGLGPGEKLHEELVTPSSTLVPTNHPKILRATEEALSELEMASALKALTTALDDGSEEEAKALVLRWVGSFQSPAYPTSTPGTVEPAPRGTA